MFIHPNVRLIQGIALLFDEPSRHSHGLDRKTGEVCIGPRMIVPACLAENLQQSALGVSLTCLTQPIEHGGRRHEPFSAAFPRAVVGFVHAADVQDGKLIITGAVHLLDFPELEALNGGTLGLCPQFDLASHERVGDDTVRLTDGIITSIAILRQDSCGFPGTAITLKG